MGDTEARGPVTSCDVLEAADWTIAASVARDARSWGREAERALKARAFRAAAWAARNGVDEWARCAAWLMQALFGAAARARRDRGGS